MPEIAQSDEQSDERRALVTTTWTRHRWQPHTRRLRWSREPAWMPETSTESSHSPPSTRTG